ncbi:PdaC/SigV domain-containing protein [Mesobacillus foraminis]|uniref:PdaC/SigV domain-containing protein n=1 Tax=Mesobacillus foraminis TaxID=279826 RepID=UPI001304E916|nr:DUF4163 domain-containing protein [Mesobacillus foraminis]
MKKIVKWTLVMVLLMAVFISSQVPAQAATTYPASVNADVLNVREKASTKSKKVGTLKKGTKVSVYSKTKSGWSEIRYKKKKAYVSTKYLRFEGAKITPHKYKNISALKYPQVSGLKSKTAQQKMNSQLTNYIKKSHGSYLSLIQDEKDLKKEEPEICREYPYSCEFEHQTSYKVKYNSTKTLSILLDEYQYWGGAHGGNYVTSYNFNLATGQPLKLTNVLNTSAKRAKVQKYVANYIKKHPTLFFSDITAKDIEIKADTPFYYYDSGIYIVFQIYSVAPYSSGNPAVKVPSSVYK